MIQVGVRSFSLRLMLIVVISVSGGLLFSLTSCSAINSLVENSHNREPNRSSSTQTDPQSATDPVFVSDGSAADNEAFFIQTVKNVASTIPGIDGRRYVDALVSGGFLKSDIQLTPDTTSIGLEADALEVAVRIGDECLIAQTTSEDVITTARTAIVDGGACLVGSTRPIEW